MTTSNENCCGGNCGCKKEIKYLVSRSNRRFWEAIHKFNSAPLWNCIIKSSWPVNPRNNRTKLVVVVENEGIFKILARATNLKYIKY